MKKITQTKICETANISPSMLSQMLSGKRRAGWGTAKKLAIVTNTDPVVWLEGSVDEIRNTLKNITDGLRHESMQ